MTGRLAAGLAAAALVGALLTGCGAPHAGVSNGSVSACYRAIPEARNALHDKSATLLGVHRVPVDDVRSHLPAAIQAEMAAEDDTVVCALSFKGKFATGQVDDAPAGESGSYAIVLVTSRRLHLVAGLVLTQLPKSLGKRTI